VSGRALRGLVLERLDAELSNTDDDGRPALAGKMAIDSVVGNEDGAHKTVADFFQATAAAARNAVHLARVLKSAKYPAYE
jgi:hypothetical protein